MAAAAATTTAAAAAEAPLAQFRKPGPNEQRCVLRHAMKLYSNLLVAAIYTIPFGLVGRDEAECLTRAESYAGAIAECVAKYPLLSAVIQGVRQGEGMRYVRVREVDAAKHFRVFEAGDLRSGEGGGESEVIRKAIERLHTDPERMFDDVENTPAWSLDLLPLEPDEENGCHRVLISFTYSHSHGDGMSGVAFHRTLLGALPASFRNRHEARRTMVIEPSSADLPKQIDASENMPISLSFLLLPALCEYLPFLTRLFGIKGDPVTGTDERTWTGGIGSGIEASTGGFVATNVEIATVDANMMKGVLDVCKQKGVKLTALLNFVIASTVRTALDQSKSGAETLVGLTNFVGSIPVNLRRGLGLSDDTLGNFGGGAYLRHDFTMNIGNEDKVEAFSIDEIPWQTIQAQGGHLAKAATNLRNQPLGLLRYVAKLESWMQSKIGKEKGCSWELSNLGSFDTEGLADADKKDDIKYTLATGPSTKASIEQAFFSQPASPIGPPLVFDVFSIKGGSLNICVSWETGALGLQRSSSGMPEEEGRLERKFVQDVARTLLNRLGTLSQWR